MSFRILITTLDIKNYIIEREEIEKKRKKFVAMYTCQATKSPKHYTLPFSSRPGAAMTINPSLASGINDNHEKKEEVIKEEENRMTEEKSRLSQSPVWKTTSVYRANTAAAAAAKRAPAPPATLEAAPGNSAGPDEVGAAEVGAVGLPAVGEGTVAL